MYSCEVLRWAIALHHAGLEGGHFTRIRAPLGVVWPVDTQRTHGAIGAYFIDSSYFKNLLVLYMDFVSSTVYVQNFYGVEMVHTRSEK